MDTCTCLCVICEFGSHASMDLVYCFATAKQEESDFIIKGATCFSNIYIQCFIEDFFFDWEAGEKASYINLV